MQNPNNSPSVEELAKPKFEFSLGGVVKGGWQLIFNNLGMSIVLSLMFLVPFVAYSAMSFIMLESAQESREGVLEVEGVLLVSSRWADDLNNFIESFEANGSVAVSDTTKQSVESVRAFVLDIERQLEDDETKNIDEISTENINQEELLADLDELSAFIASVKEEGSIDTTDAKIALNNVQAYYDSVFSTISIGAIAILVLLVLIFIFIFMLPVTFILHFGLVALSKGTASVRDMFPSMGKVVKYIVAYILYQVLLIVIPVISVGIIALGVFASAWIGIIVTLLLMLIWIFVAVRYAFVGFSILDRNTSIIESFKDSSTLVSGAYLKLIGITIVVSIITGLSMFLTLGLGILFFVYPFSYFCYAYTYKALQQRADEKTSVNNQGMV